MTPAARAQAAITVLDAIGDGMAAERALTNWARSARYAGSGDRAAVRDMVFDILRRWRSTAIAGGGATGRARVIGAVRLQGLAPETLFTGVRYAPAPLSAAELAEQPAPSGADALDLPDWLVPLFRDSLGDRAEPVAQALRQRAPVFLRVNRLRATVETARAALAHDGIEAVPHPTVPWALEVTGGARRLAQGAAYREGLIELQDAASQAVVDLLPLGPDARVLDYCAGGGGKALALAARLDGPIDAHDATPRRMSDLPQRARRAGADIRVLAQAPDAAGCYDLVLCDAPCSGSGAWRRAPEGKWVLTPQQLDALNVTQDQILAAAARLVKPGGTLAYATCSVLRSENDDRVAAFLSRHPGWRQDMSKQFLPGPEGDGFFIATLREGRV